MAFTKILGPGIATDTDVQVDDILAGIVTAEQFVGDASLLTGLPAGLGTALSSDAESPLNALYYVDNILSIGSTITVNTPDSSVGAYTQYSDIVVEQDADLIIGDGDDFIPDVLGLSTEGSGVPLTGAGGRLRVDNITDKTGSGAPNFPNGITVGGGALNDEKQHSGSAFQNVVYETPHVINITDDLTLTSLYSESSTMYCKRREVIVDPTKTLTIAPGDTFVINPLNL
jgi:hypothetical protein